LAGHETHMKIATHQPHLDHGVGAFNAADVAEPTVVPPPQMDTDHLLHLNDKIDASTAAILDLANSSATMEHLLFDIHHTFATLGLEGSHLDASHLTDLFSHLEHAILSQCKGGTQPSSAALSSSPGATPGAAEGAPSLAATPLSPETIRSLSEETAAAARRAIADLKPEIASPLAEIKTKLESEAATLSAAVKQVGGAVAEAQSSLGKRLARVDELAKLPATVEALRAEVGQVAASQKATEAALKRLLDQLESTQAAYSSAGGTTSLIVSGQMLVLAVFLFYKRFAEKRREHFL